jgi:hypothetical protein
MRQAQVPIARVHAVLRSLHKDRRLIGLVRKMAKEIERLDEDNAQLHAALQVYREIVRQRDARDG